MSSAPLFLNRDNTQRGSLGRTVLSRRAVLFGAAGIGAASVAGLSALNLPTAAANDLRIYSTEEWGANAPNGDIAINRLNYRPSKIVVHHMDSPNVTDYSQEAAFKIARDCQSWHVNNGWADSGQQFSVSRGGYVLEGRHGSLAAAQDGSYFIEGIQAAGCNRETIGIENEGRYEGELPTDAQWAALVQLIAYLCRQYGLDSSAIIGHRDCSSTACPGSAFYGALGQLRADVDAALAGGGGAPTPPPEPEQPEDPGMSWPVTKRGDSGNAVLAVQRLLQHHGWQLEADTSFGPATEQAIFEFQSANGLGVDGAVGQETWPALIVFVRQGDSGSAVIGLQELLNKHGARLEVDGVFGSATDQAVREFQELQHFDADAIAGPITWKGLVTV